MDKIKEEYKVSQEVADKIRVAGDIRKFSEKIYEAANSINESLWYLVSVTNVINVAKKDWSMNTDEKTLTNESTNEVVPFTPELKQLADFKNGLFKILESFVSNRTEKVLEKYLAKLHDEAWETAYTEIGQNIGEGWTLDIEINKIIKRNESGERFESIMKMLSH